MPTLAESVIPIIANSGDGDMGEFLKRYNTERETKWEAAEGLASVFASAALFGLEPAGLRSAARAALA